MTKAACACASVRPSETNASPYGLTFLCPKGPEMIVKHILEQED